MSVALPLNLLNLQVKHKNPDYVLTLLLLGLLPWFYQKFVGGQPFLKRQWTLLVITHNINISIKPFLVTSNGELLIV